MREAVSAMQRVRIGLTGLAFVFLAVLLATFAFLQFAPPVYAALFWKRSTKWGALAAALLLAFSPSMLYFSRFIRFDHDWLSQGLILARNEVDYRLPVLFTDEIEVEIWCSSIGKKSIEMRYVIVRKGDRPGICAEGRSVLVSYNANTASSIEVPAHWRAALEKYM